MGKFFLFKSNSFEIRTNPLLRLFVFVSTVLSKEWRRDPAFLRAL
jgi:hypothetical protein